MNFKNIIFLQMLQDVLRIADDCIWIVPFAAKFAGSLGKLQRPSSDLSDVVDEFFGKWLACSDRRIRNAVVAGFCEYARWTRCGKRIAGYSSLSLGLVENINRLRGTVCIKFRLRFPHLTNIRVLLLALLIVFGKGDHCIC